MSDINKSIELYELIIARLRKSGNAPNQLAAYEGSLECIRGCATAEEAMDALAASPWYTAVAQGLAMDDLEAKKKAAVELGWDDVVSAYDAKIDEVRGDYLKAWDTTYVTNIQQLVAAHYSAREAEILKRLSAVEEAVNAIEDTDINVEDEWKSVLAIKDEVIAIGAKELAKTKRAKAVATAPLDKTGDYSFDCTEKEVF